MCSPSVQRSDGESAPLFEPQLFPRSRRLRKRAEFQRVYQEGKRLGGVLFAAFVRSTPGAEPGRLGLTVPRAIGNAVTRNRVKRRLRESVRRNWAEFPDGCEIVIHARRPLAEADGRTVEAEIQRVLQRAATIRASRS